MIRSATRMSVNLLSLYQSLLVPVLSEWINDKDLCYLDTSVCNHDLTRHYPSELYEWIALRDIRLKVINLSQPGCELSLCRDDNLLFLQAAGNLEFVALLKTRCLYVETLKLTVDISDDTLELILKSLRGIRTLDVSNYSKLTNAINTIIVDHCPTLRCIHCFVGQDIQPLLEGCEQLELIHNCEFLKCTCPEFLVNLDDPVFGTLKKTTVNDGITLSIGGKFLHLTQIDACRWYDDFHIPVRLFARTEVVKFNAIPSDFGLLRPQSK